jgi:hypothetical protein
LHSLLSWAKIALKRKIEMTTNSRGVSVPFFDNPLYLENQWAQDTIDAFEQEHGQKEEALPSILCHFAKWCDVNGLQLSEMLKEAAALYSEESEGEGRQFAGL